MQCILESWSICLLNCNFYSFGYSKVICSFLCNSLCLPFSYLRYFYSFFSYDTPKLTLTRINITYFGSTWDTEIGFIIYQRSIIRHCSEGRERIQETKLLKCWNSLTPIVSKFSGIGLHFFWFVDWTQLYFKSLLKGDQSSRNMCDRIIN